MSVDHPAFPSSYEDLLMLIKNEEWCSAWEYPSIKSRDQDTYYAIACITWRMAGFVDDDTDDVLGSSSTSILNNNAHDNKYDTNNNNGRCWLTPDSRIARYLITGNDPCLGLAEITRNQLDNYAISVVELVTESITDGRLPVIHDMLFHVIRRGNELKCWSLCYLTIMVNIERPRPRTTLNNIDQLRYGLTLYKYTQNLFNHRIDETKITAYLLLSAMLYDGCLSKKCLKNFINSIGTSVRHSNNTCWIDLYDENNRIYRRVYLDHYTLMLWCRHDMENHGTMSPTTVIEDLAHNIVGGERKSYKYIRTAVSQVLAEFVPEFLLSLAEDNYNSQPISSVRWDRIMDIKSLRHDGYRSDDSQQSLFYNHVIPDQVDDIDMSSEVLGHLMDCNDLELLRVAMRMNNADDIKNELLNLQHLSLTNPISKLLARWLIDLTTKKHISVVKRFFSCLGARLIDAFGEVELTEYDQDDIGLILQRTIDSGRSSSNRNMIRAGLKSFVDYLKISHTHIDANVFVSAYEQEFANANIINSDEHLRALNNFRCEKRFYHEYDITELICVTQILFFRAGFRLKELIYLPMHDLFITDNDIIIRIRDHEFRTLKTPSSKRTVPLRPLLSSEEYVFVREYLLAHKIDFYSKRIAYVFYCPGVNQESFKAKIAETITSMLREVTGDPSVTLHHLRHSFVSWLSLSMISSAAKLNYDIFNHLPETKKYLETTSIKLRKAANVNNENDISLMYIVARLAGHVNPGTTIESYAHLLDIVLSGCFHKFIATYKPTISHCNTDIPERTLRRHKNTDLNDFIYAHFIKQYPHKFVETIDSHDDNYESASALEKHLNIHHELKHLCSDKDINTPKHSNNDSEIITLHHRCLLLLHKYPLFNKLFCTTNNRLMQDVGVLARFFESNKSIINIIPRTLFDNYIKFVDNKSLMVVFHSQLDAKDFLYSLRNIGFLYRDFSLHATGIVKTKTSLRRNIKEWRDGLNLPKSVRLHDMVKVNPKHKKIESVRVTINVDNPTSKNGENMALLWLMFTYSLNTEEITNHIND